MARIGVDQSVLDAFRCTQVAIPLPGGEGRTYRSGHTILRWESNPLEANYLAEFSTKSVHQALEFRDRFQIPTGIGLLMMVGVLGHFWKARLRTRRICQA
jgi:hypothetical protein